MRPKPTLARGPPEPPNPFLDHSPLPMATVEGAMHILLYANPAFCRRIDKTKDELLGQPLPKMLPEAVGCPAALDRVYRTGKFESQAEPDGSAPGAVFSSYTMWPVMADERPVGVMIQLSGTAPLLEETLAINEALLLGSLRQHELTEVAASFNDQLRTEIGEHKQREHDALMLTNEISHRIKNNLQIVATLIGYEARKTAAPCVEGYRSMQARIAAIAGLYDLISQSSGGSIVHVDAYLREIAKNVSASLLGSGSGIRMEVESEALDIDPDRALPFGLLVNELVTNAIKHAFPDGRGRIVLRAERSGDQIELTVADNGVGMKNNNGVKVPEKHGADYMAMFLRQLGGTIAASGAEGSGTVVKVRLPLLRVSPSMAMSTPT
jgi:two-component sensor histidine kinase